ncbi:hypothetical protein F3Y22_tig00110020pilonHSYRG00302 [Hibiscus syriacus]|uniref:Uncharacterized protein n=1 Tax=Hibiscus syriacus TaxID=106335 RepID=A0A6A3BLS8_HIBSY|nr:hypothetical protein F3Y22_tig00110020pilonHSYRG00302 [Hibiscus syriacus]
MEDQWNWGFFHNEEGMEDLKHTLLFTTLELENALISAKEEITKRDLELIHLKEILLAGPLPQWQQPPPQLAVIEIPPVAISSTKQQLVKQESFNNVNGCLDKKRSLENYEDLESSPNTKYQKVALH